MSQSINPIVSADQFDALVSAVHALEPKDNLLGPEFVASILGAVVGGLIAAGIQYFSYREQRRERLLADKQRQAACAFSILTKINRALSTISATKRQVDKAVHECVKRGVSLSGAFEAFSGDMPRFDLTTDEIELLRRTKNSELIADIMNLPHVHDMYVDTMAMLRDYKLQLVELQDSTEIMADGRGSSVFVGSNASKAKVKSHQADKLISALLAFTMKDCPSTRKLLSNAQEAFVELVGKEHIGLIWAVNDSATS